MTFFTGIMDFLIRPLELFFETIFTLSFKVFPNPGTSIVFLSLVMNLLLMPLYKRADEIQAQTMQEEASLKGWTDHIKKNFKGDERYMMLQTYYRQRHYKPTHALRGSVSLLLEIPFFMAAYRFLSQLLVLYGWSFGPIPDLGYPDGMLTVAGNPVNVLPVLMTAINLVSGYIYTRGYPLKSKIQLYGMALIFLVLLYDSPSGLVLYWTLNNLFSLFKNILGKIKHSRLVVSAAASAVSLVLLVQVVVLHPLSSWVRELAVVLPLLALQLPLIIYVLKKHNQLSFKPVSATKQDRDVFFLSALLMTVVTGLLIPSAIVANSPGEFVNASVLTNPMWYVFSAFLTAAGTFLVWFGIFYTFAGPGLKKIMSGGMVLLSGASIIDYMFFGRHYGNLSPNMKFDFLPVPSGAEKLQNMAVLFLAAALLLLVLVKKKELIRGTCMAAAIAVAVMSVLNMAGIYSGSRDTIREYRQTAEDYPTIPLSKHGKNVLVLMMDRAVGLNVPYIFDEKPELKEQFRGFSYYPYTISHGSNTNLGSPGIFGGYEYTPDQMNLRTGETLEQKHDEALRVLPRIFLEEGYKTTIVDPPLAGYDVVSPSSIYEEYPGMDAYWLMRKFDYVSPEMARNMENKTSRNLFYYSLFKISPSFIQPILYANGSYNDLDELEAEHLHVDQDAVYGQIAKSPSVATGLQSNFMRSYKALQILPELTEIRDTDENTFLALANNLPHSPMILKEPEYTPEMVVDNREYDALHEDRFIYEGYEMAVDGDGQMANHHCNMATMIELGKWFDYLKANGVYDNTRIIVVSDHGYPIKHFENLTFIESWPYDVLAFNALLMVKDFNSTSDFTMDKTFMTNADVPHLAMKGLIENPVNPFTGKPMDGNAKNQKTQTIFTSIEWDIDKNNTPQYLPSDWYAVSPDIFRPDSWQLISRDTVLPES